MDSPSVNKINSVEYCNLSQVLLTWDECGFSISLDFLQQQSADGETFLPRGINVSDPFEIP